MANLLQLKNGMKSFGGREIFNSISFSIDTEEHIGVIGPNGAGKTTLFKSIVGKESLDSGQFTFRQGLRIGYLEQEAEWDLGKTAEEYLTMDPQVHKPIWELKKLGLGLGLQEALFSAKLSELSGGYRMRFKLLAILGMEPDLMLLDEPTNFLDLESLLALETFLQGYKGSFLLISHDREFLRRVTDHTLEVEAGDVHKFPGNIDDYFEEKAEMEAQLVAVASNLEQKRKHIQSFIDRFKSKATKARQAQSRMKMLDKLGTVKTRDLPVRARISMPLPIETGKEVVTIESAVMGYPDKVVLTSVDLRLLRGHHWGIVGVNGAGKSTLLKTIAQRLPLISGSYKLGYKVEISYFAQHVTEDLLWTETVLEALQRGAHGSCTRQEILNMAGSFLFSGDDIYKPIKVLSGGEKSRVALGQILLKKNPVLILDEPTNHLDFDTVEALTLALSKYTGTLIVVSHDRSFIGRVAQQILEVSEGGVHFYPGTYDEYLWSLAKGSYGQGPTSIPKEQSPIANSKDKAESPSKANPKADLKRVKNEILKLDKVIKNFEEQLHQCTWLRDEATSKLISAKGEAASALAREVNQQVQEIEKIEALLLKAMEEQQSLQRSIQKF